MKHLNLILLLFLLSTFISCKRKDVSPVNPIDQLPAASKSGLNTIGCLVNGKALVPKGDTWGDISYSCQYQYLDNSISKGYYFNVDVNNTKDNPSRAVYVQARSLDLEEGKTYPLVSRGVDGNAHALYTSYSSSTGPTDYFTNEVNKGELTITKLDKYNQIISGTFWFDAVNKHGEKVEVREGRFDMKYIK
jgi:hypothetical protein